MHVRLVATRRSRLTLRQLLRLARGPSQGEFLSQRQFQLGFAAIGHETRRLGSVALTTAVAISALWYPHATVVHAEASVSEHDTIEDPDSKWRFPKSITLHDGAMASIVGLGVRTLSFLRIKVYVVALYVRDQDLSVLKKWKGFDKGRFMSSKDESLSHQLLDQPVDVVVRIVPIRDTNGQHLKDGFARALVNRMQSDDSLEDQDTKNVVKALKDFKNLFPRSSVKAGTAFLFTKQKDGSLRMEYQNKHLGTIHNEWLAKNLVMSYLAAANPISEKAKQSIANGLDDLINN